MWHRDPFPLMFQMFRHTSYYPCLFMVSHGRIGTLGAELLGMWDVGCVHGSRQDRGIAAVTELAARARKEGGSVFIMGDGSRGPNRQARWGPVYLARDAGLPLLALGTAGTNFVTLKSTWMKLVLPKPWGRTVVMSSEPIIVPPSAKTKEQLEPYRLELEQKLNEMGAVADDYLAKGGR
jgi:hypothetical protein